MLRETSTGEAPWYVVEGADERYRNLTVGKILLDAMQSVDADETRDRQCGSQAFRRADTALGAR